MRGLLPYLDLDVARELVGAGPTDNRGGPMAPELPFGVDPARVRAGPPPGVRLPGPDPPIKAFLAQTRSLSAGGSSPDR